MSVFGIPKNGGHIGSIKTYSPQKTKKINKFSKPGNK